MSTSTNASTTTVISVSSPSSSDTFLSSTAPMTSTSSTSSILSSISSSPSASSASSSSSTLASPSTMASSSTDRPPVSASSSSVSSSTTPQPPPSSSSSASSSSTPPPPPPSSSSASVSSSSTPPPPPPSSSSSSSSSSEPPPPPPSSSSRPVSSTSAQTPTSTPAVDPPASSNSNSPVIPPPSSSSSSSSRPPENTFSTLSSRVVITTTDSRGVTSTTAPSVITETSTSTQQDGSLVTVTQIYSNPTLSPDNNTSKGNSFFSNTGAVAGVFVLVGLAAASIILWIFFAVRRRRRTQRLEHDTAVSATLAAAGFHRTPLDDDDDPAAGARHMRYGSNEDPFQRRSSSGLAMSSVPSAGRASAYLDRTPDENGEFNPYASGDYIVPAGARDGYISGTPLNPNSNATQAPQSALIGDVRRDRSNSSGLAEMGAAGHAHNHSNSGSFEPLLASYYRRSMGNPPSPVLPMASVGAAELTGSDAPLPPDSNTVRFPPAYSSSHGHDNPQGDSNNANQPLVQFDDAASSVYSNNSVVVDERLDPGLRQRLQHNTSTSSRDLRDEEDYSRPVLGVRNLPDGASQMSA